MWYRLDIHQQVIVLNVHVQPNAKTTAIAGLYGDSVKIRLSTPPVDGKANKALLAYLADCFGVPLRDVTLESGHQSRQKRVRIANVNQLPNCFKEVLDAS